MHLTTAARGLLAALSDRVARVERGAELVPGIVALPAPGRTAGHMALAVASGEEQLLYLADSVYAPIHCEHPEWYAPSGLRPAQLVTSRWRLLDQAVAEQALVLAPRFTFPGLGRLAQVEDAWRWQPLQLAAARGLAVAQTTPHGPLVTR